MDYVTPLFVFGMGRSGTTNTLRVLNYHPEVMLNGEIALPVLKQLFKTIEQAEANYERREAARDGWYDRKAEYIFESFGYLAKGGRGKLHKREHAEYMGHKTPRLESMFDEYEAHFASVNMKPRYFYCARNPFDCWRSYRATTWTRYGKVEEFLEQYAASFQTLERIRPIAGARLNVLNLDEMKAAPDTVAFYCERIFKPLDLPVSDRLRQVLKKSLDDREGREKPAEIPDSDRKAIETWPGIAELHEKMFAPHIRARAAMPSRP